MRDLLTNDTGLRTAEERDAHDALRNARPDLAGRFAPALARARAANAEKLRSALGREGFEDSTPLVLPAHPVAMVDAVMGARNGGSGPEHWARLRAEVAASVAAHALALVAESDRRERLASTTDADSALRWAVRRAGEDPGFSPLAVFEQAVVDGHPWHPGARMRVGMSYREVIAYTPEWADEVALGLVAVERGVDRGVTALLRREYPRLIASAHAWLGGRAARRRRYALLPVHPWQLRHLVPDRYASGLADERIVVIPRAEIAARPLLSVRTFAPAHDRLAPHLKTAMNVQLTSAVRIVSPAAAGNGPRLSRLLREISGLEDGFAGRFVVLSELASGHYRPTPDEPEEMASGLSAILRESPERHAGAGELALPVAALTARSPLRDRPLLHDVLAHIGGTPRDAVRSFVAALCECALAPLFTLLSRWGVALEAHGQNTVVVLRGGLPVRLAYRDLGGVRLSPTRLGRRGLAVPEIAGTLATDNEEELRAKLFGALVSTSLAELVPALSRAADVPAAGLWELVARGCRTAYRPLLDDPDVREQARRDLSALLAPTVPAKMLLRMRLADDPLAERWTDLPNPLAAAA